MRNLTNVFLISFSLLLSLATKAQIAINSPYTRFGIGEISQSGSGLNKALGGTTIGHRFGNQINFMNPASYSAQDTLSFILDFGLNGDSRELSTAYENVKRNNFNMGHFAISFPVSKWWGASIGVLPYSRIGYNMVVNGTFLNSEDTYSIYYEGNGNLTKFYIGSGFRIGKHLSVGSNMSYIFGNYARNRRVRLAPDREGTAETFYENTTTLGDVLFNFGIQGFSKLGKNSNLVVGATLDNKTKLNGDFSSLILHNYLTSDTLQKFENQNGTVTIPLRMGLGGTYTYKDKLMFAVDYISQDWSKARFFGNPDSLAKSTSLRFGIQYIPVALSEVKRASYWKRINFRAGGYYNNTYLEINGNHVKDYGITFGVGIPWRNEKNLLTKTSFNLAYQIGWKGSLNNGLVKESYQVFSVGLVLYDFWFIQRKYD